jgi:hypothetical protein
MTGVTRRSVLDLAQTWRHVSADASSDSNGPQATLTVSERAITMGEVATAAKAGRLQEVLVTAVTCVTVVAVSYQLLHCAHLCYERVHTAVIAVSPASLPLLTLTAGVLHWHSSSSLACKSYLIPRGRPTVSRLQR